MYGVDIEPACRPYEGENVRVLFGDQAARRSGAGFAARRPQLISSSTTAVTGRTSRPPRPRGCPATSSPMPCRSAKTSRAKRMLSRTTSWGWLGTCTRMATRRPDFNGPRRVSPPVSVPRSHRGRGGAPERAGRALAWRAVAADCVEGRSASDSLTRSAAARSPRDAKPCTIKSVLADRG